MGVAFARISLPALEELLGFSGAANIVGVIQPGMFDLQRQTVILQLESPGFPPPIPGMLIPEVYLSYETRQEDPIFKGFQVVEDKHETPSDFFKFPPSRDRGPAPPRRCGAPLDPNEIGRLQIPGHGSPIQMPDDMRPHPRPQFDEDDDADDTFNEPDDSPVPY